MTCADFMIVLPVDDGARSRPLAPITNVIDLTEPSGEADEDPVHCLRHVYLVGGSRRKSVETAQAKMIVELEEACANLKLKKESVTAGYRRLANKYKKHEAKVNALEHEKTDAAEVHVAQVDEVEQKLVETQDYTNYRLNF
jgi:hypothetical protein